MSEARIVPLNAGIVASNLRHIGKGSLKATVDLEIAAWHMKISCLWMQFDKGEWISLPTERFTKPDGKTVYRKLVEFTDREASDRFQRSALAAVRRLDDEI